MIYEIRTYDLKPGSQPEVEKRFAAAYEHRRKHSELAAFWHTEIGALNQHYDELRRRYAELTGSSAVSAPRVAPSK